MNVRENLENHLKQLVRDRDPYLATQGYFYVQDYIRQQFSQWGAVEADEFIVSGKQHCNRVLHLAGRDRMVHPVTSHVYQKPPILIGAHFDTVPGSPGADDNATGVAVMLELARLLAIAPARHPIQCIAFDLEEYGWGGSRHYVACLRQRGQALRLMLSLEMLGYCDRTPGSQRYPPGLHYFYPNRGDFIALVGNWQTIPDLIHLSRGIRRVGNVPCEWLPAGQRGRIVPDTRRSDHAPFWDAGYRALMVTDTGHLRNPHYHKPSDRLETLDLEFLTGICLGLAYGIRTL